MEERIKEAREYARQAKERNKAPCQCQRCIEADLLPRVQRLTEAWSRDGRSRLVATAAATGTTTFRGVRT